MQGAGSRGEHNRSVAQRVDRAHRVMFPELQEEMNRRDIAITYVNTNNLDNRQNNTYQKYVGYYDNIWDFFKEIGEIASMIILLEQCPEFPPPMDASAIKKYLIYKEVVIRLIYSPLMLVD